MPIKIPGTLLLDFPIRQQFSKGYPYLNRETFIKPRILYSEVFLSSKLCFQETHLNCFMDRNYLKKLR